MRTSIWTKLFDMVAPRPCAVCGGRLSAEERIICSQCHLHLPLTHYEEHATDNPLARLFWGLLPIERATALFHYEPQSDCSQMIYDMKYRGMREIGVALGCLTAQRAMAQGFFSGIDALVPMPITRSRQWQRGYNQSREIARGVSEATGLPIYNKVVKRIRFTTSQTAQHAWERLRNVEGAFQLVDAGQIAHRHVLLIDDIVTTGATLTACGLELAKAEGVRISVLALCHTKS